MPGVSYYKKKGTLRIYSPATTTTGGATADKYLEMRFQNGNINWAMGPAFPEQQLVLDRNAFSSEAHWIDVDDTTVLTPLPFSFEILGVDKYMQTALRSLSNVFGEGGSTGWTVGNFLWTGFNESAVTRKDGANTSITIPEFALTAIKLVRAEIKLTKTSTDAGVTDAVFKLTGINFPRDQVSAVLANDSLNITANGLIYGDVTLATAFSTGTQTDT